MKTIALMKTARPLVLLPALLLLGASALLALLISGCVFSPQRRAHKSGSVVAFLFPKTQPSLQVPSLPTLALPLRVGVAFVPDARGNFQSTFSEMQKQQLLKRVADQFRALPFVRAIEIVPSTYLRPEGSFENLEQIRSLLGIEVIALVSYDQVQFTEQNVFSIAYWTIIGAYIFNGNRNDTHTLMEATVYDIPSRSLLFRAPGVNQTKASTGVAYLEGALRKDSSASLDKATTDLIGNLDTALANFRQTVKDGRSEVKIEHKPGYAGEGALDGLTMSVMLSVIAASVLFQGRKRLGATGQDSSRPSTTQSSLDDSRLRRGERGDR